MNAVTRPCEYCACDIESNVAGSKGTAVSHGSGTMPCNAHGAISQEISKMSWGGPRANSGGARPGAGRKPRPIAAPEPLGKRWYVIETFGHGEQQVAHELARQGWAHYLPLVAMRKRDRVVPSMIHKVLVPMFPGYLFVEFDRDGLTWGAIRDQIAGVRNIIRGGDGKPAPIPSNFVPDLKATDAKRLELASLANPARARGTMLRVADGPFTSFPGSVVACDGYTTTVNVHLFGRLVPVAMAWDDLIEV